MQTRKKSDQNLAFEIILFGNIYKKKNKSGRLTQTPACKKDEKHNKALLTTCT